MSEQYNTVKSLINYVLTVENIGNSLLRHLVIATILSAYEFM